MDFETLFYNGEHSLQLRLDYHVCIYGLINLYDVSFTNRRGDYFC